MQNVWVQEFQIAFKFDHFVVSHMFLWTLVRGAQAFSTGDMTWNHDNKIVFLFCHWYVVFKKARVS